MFFFDNQMLCNFAFFTMSGNLPLQIHQRLLGAVAVAALLSHDQLVLVLSPAQEPNFPTDRLSFWLRRQRPTRNQVTVAKDVEMAADATKATETTGATEFNLRG